MTQKEFVSMKKILSLFLLIAVAVFGLTACLQDDEAENSYCNQ